MHHDDAAGTDLAFDISHFQPTVDFTAARRAGLRAVLQKATEGLHYIDPRYVEAREQARAASLLWGTYHFGTGEDALAQAAHFLDIVKPDGETLLVLDLERNPAGASMNIEQARTFVTQVHQATGKRPGLYSGSYIRDHLGNHRDAVYAPRARARCGSRDAEPVHTFLGHGSAVYPMATAVAPAHSRQRASAGASI